ncbi:MAG: succinate dehydrogenase/fumarate reductase iron-sulfur subunit [Methanobacteriota archaeon]|nr:MAG: succinate dehydrogenase/fumarate reductase iron-sulfur subunit [Euryarchaeota archaeon]
MLQPPTTKTIKLRIGRYRPERSAEPFYQEFTVPFRDDMVVLDALNYIKDHIDPTLTYRWSCRMGICGSCGANVDGTPRLTCAMYLKDLKRRPVVIEPLENFAILKDLVVDIEPFMEKLEAVKPYILRQDERPIERGEYRQTPEELELYRQQSQCINCMLCYAACPVYGHEEKFLGPAALALALRYEMDTRDQGSADRLAAIATEHGIWQCTFVGECSVVCPKHVDPAGAIQQLKVRAANRLMKAMLLPLAPR